MILLWGVLDGPYEDPDYEGHLLLCQVQTDDTTIAPLELRFSTFDNAYKIKSYFDSNIFPLSPEEIEERVGTYDRYYEQINRKSN